MDKIITIIPKMADSKQTDIALIIKGYTRRLKGFIRKRVVEEADVEDILQDVFYQLAGNTEPIEQLTAWLFRVARNKITDKTRKHKPYLLEDLLTGYEDNWQHGTAWIAQVFDQKESPENQYLRSLFWSTLHKALDELPQEQKNVFVWHEMEGQSFKEIAEHTGESVNTLLSRKHYAIRHLRKRLKNLYNELLDY
jgi:RNA polymerase sigma factor (sigma-70 family)